MTTSFPAILPGSFGTNTEVWMIIAESAGLTDIGRVRENNEDAFLVDEKLSLFVVADGMGGYSGGEIASRMVVDSLSDSFTDRRSKRLLADKSTGEVDFLKVSIKTANQDVYNKSKQLNGAKGMGSTVAAVSFYNSFFVAANVGDSHIYLVRDNGIGMVSTPHTVAYECEAKDPDLARVLKKSFKHILTRSVGVTSTVVPDAAEFHCMKDDIVVLCSDGLSNMVTEQEILSAVSTKSPSDACSFLIKKANENGGSDNITVVVVKVIDVTKFNLLTRLFYKLFRRK